jgi:hypothetical protein
VHNVGNGAESTCYGDGHADRSTTYGCSYGNTNNPAANDDWSSDTDHYASRGSDAKHTADLDVDGADDSSRTEFVDARDAWSHTTHNRNDT